MRPGFDIMNEEDPFLREIWAAGWDEVYFDRCTQSILLIDRENKITKTIDDYMSLCGYQNWYIKSGILPDGRMHRWIAESNGDAYKFRQIIKK